MSKEVDPQEVRRWVELLRSGSDEQKAYAASELSRVAIRTRGAVRTRGSLESVARGAFPEAVREDAMQAAWAALQAQVDPAVRREVAFALGQWADETAVNVLKGMLVGPNPDPDEGVRQACVEALKTIGGRSAVQGLCVAAEGDQSEAVRYAAIAALAELIAEERQSRPKESGAPAPTVSHAIRTRGAAVSPPADLSPAALSAFHSLVRIRDNDQEREYLRRMAEDALAALVIS